MSNELVEFERAVQTQLARVMVGADSVVRALVVALIARGHVLIQGPPGLGKTLLAKCFAKVMGGDFERIQGTADLMPSDIIGVHVYDEARAQFEFRRGPLFAAVLLVDEINRAGPKTQSALLEAMEERQVSTERDVWPLPDDFLVIATQNPHEYEGTYPLPESQLDRFMLRLDLTYPQAAVEQQILLRYGADLGGATQVPADLVVIDRDVVAAVRTQAEQIHVAVSLIGYVLELVRASREHPRIELGLSTRGALAMVRAAQVLAGLRGADFATADDIKQAARWAMPHRLRLSPQASIEGDTDTALVESILSSTPVPR